MRCIILAPLTLIATVGSLRGQAGQGPLTKGLTLTVLQGDGVQNELPRPAATHLSIRVLDSQSNPITNAVAAFELPEAGASAAFADGSAVKVLLTDSSGDAIVDIKPNDLPGKFQPRITVNYLGQTTSVALNQENLYPAPTAAATGNRLVRQTHAFSHSHKKWLLAAVGGAVVAVIVALVVHHHSSSNKGGITINPGTGSVGGN